MNKFAAPRTREKLDSKWLFYKGDIHIPQAIKSGVINGYTDSRDMNDSWYESWLIGIYKDDKWRETLRHNWVEVDLPHDWCIEQDILNEDKRCHVGGIYGTNISGFLPYGVGCYRKFFNLPPSDKGKKIYIEFEGIARNSTIWMNGYRLGTHYSGYAGFSHDITDIALYGDEGVNTIFVRVDASEAESWWYEGCGIYRHVWLVKCNRLHITSNGTYITTPEITEKSSVVNIQTTIRNEYCEKSGCNLKTTILDPDGNAAGTVSSICDIKPYDCGRFEQVITVEDPKLWSPENPFLYSAVTEIIVDGEVADKYETYFGIRLIEFTKDNGLFLNGKYTVLKGVCCHQDFAGLGVALPDDVNEYRIKLLKEMGANAYRSAHNPASPALLDICDRLGMMVIEENRRLDSTEEGVLELESMLYRDRNHPSIILWSMHNEELLEGTEIGKRILKTMVDITHKVDPTRPVTAATMCHLLEKPGYCDSLDIVGINYGTKEAYNDKYHIIYPAHKMLNSENISLMVTRGIYETDFEKGHMTSYANQKENNALGDNSPEYVWKNLMENPYLYGIFIWTGFDYRGECQWPNITRNFGIMDACGFPKDIYYYWKSQWSDEPVLHVFPHWNWNGREGEDIEVLVYSNCDSVEMFLNGESYGEKKAMDYSYLVWNVRYTPGELSAIGMKNGKAVTEKKILTTGATYGIRLEPNKDAIRANGCDVSVVRACIVDKDNNVVPIVDNEFKFTVEGPGKILGVGNGNPSSHESEKSNIRRAFNGYCLVIIQAKQEAGEIVLKAASTGLIPAVAKVIVTAEGE
jgi:Beta-galactosidase/beta-glucuronidase